MDKYLTDNEKLEKNLTKAQVDLTKLNNIKKVINSYKEQIYSIDVDIYRFKELKESYRKDLVELKPEVKKYKKNIIPVVIFSLMSIISIVLTIITPTDLSKLFLIIGLIFTTFTTAALAGTVQHDRILYKEQLNSIERVDESIKKSTSQRGDIFAQLLDYTKFFPEDDIHEDITNLNKYINDANMVILENNTKRSNLLEEYAKTLEGEEYLNSNYESIDIGERPIIKTKIKEKK